MVAWPRAVVLRGSASSNARQRGALALEKQAPVAVNRPGACVTAAADRR